MLQHAALLPPLPVLPALLCCCCRPPTCKSRLTCGHPPTHPHPAPNPAVMPHGAMVDYEPCVLLTLPPGAGLRDAFRARGGYATPGAVLEELRAEGAEARRARWAHLPPAVLQREPPWLV